MNMKLSLKKKVKDRLIQWYVFFIILCEIYIIITPALIYVAYCIANSSLLVLTKSNYEQSTYLYATMDKMFLTLYIITIISFLNYIMYKGGSTCSTHIRLQN